MVKIALLSFFYMQGSSSIIIIFSDLGVLMFTVIKIFRKKYRINLFSSLSFFVFYIFAILLFSSSAQAKQYGLFIEDTSYGGYSSVDADRGFEAIAGTEVKWTGIVAMQLVDNIDSTTIYRSSEEGVTPSDAALVHAINKAHSLGLSVMLYPHLDLANDSQHWFGEIGKNFNAQQWDNWFASYTQFIVHYADIAAKNGVEQLSVGMELMYTEKQEAHWRELISQVRRRYSGSLIYAENYDTETFATGTSNVRWWDALDYIGIDAYYDLIPEGNIDPTLADMLEAWKPIVKRLEAYSAEWNKPILISELGYRSEMGSTHHPWREAVGNPVDLQEQADAYQAFYESFVNKPWFAGVFWYSHSTSEPDSIENRSYSPIGKPAGNIVRQYK